MGGNRLYLHSLGYGHDNGTWCSTQCQEFVDLLRNSLVSPPRQELWCTWLVHF